MKPKVAPKPAPQRDEVPRCDCCGAASPVLIREPVEGIVCERCPDCQREGLAP